MVGVQGFEPWTPCSQSRCATRLRYTPTESIFYTESAITGKSCKIRAMVAYFSSIFMKQIRSAFTAALLVLCLLGTHWVGLSHGISHSGFQSQSLEVVSTTGVDKSFSHTSDICHLFDALSLAGFIPSTQLESDLSRLSALNKLNADHSSPRYFANSAYYSRAPPSFIL